MEIFIGASILSIWHSILFWNQRIGFSGILFTIPLLIITMRIIKEKAKNPKALLLSIPIILLSSTYFIFNNEVFRTLNIIIIPVLYVMMVIFTTTSKFELKAIIYKVIAMVIEPLNEFGEVFKNLKFAIIEKLNIKSKTKEKTNKANIVKAVFFTGIILIIVLALLSSADDDFAEIIGNILSWITKISIPTLAIRILLIIFLFFYISAFFIDLLSKYNVLKEFEETEKVKKKESLTIRMILVALNIVYLIFCFVEIKSLLTTKNIIYSQFARQGFFQLMIVSLINLVVILKATNKNLEENEKQKKFKKTMCIIMLVFTLLIIISSFARMIMYQTKYGDTRLRILVDFTLITEIILLIPTAIYIIKENINLSKSYFIIIVTMYCIINFANIDKIIAKNNVDRFIETGKIDLDYLITLNSTDITSELIRLKETDFKYYEINNDNDEHRVEVYRERLDKYLENQLKQLDENNRTISETNLSEWFAQKALNDAGI